MIHAFLWERMQSANVCLSTQGYKQELEHPILGGVEIWPNADFDVFTLFIFLLSNVNLT